MVKHSDIETFDACRYAKFKLIKSFFIRKTFDCDSLASCEVEVFLVENSDEYSNGIRICFLGAKEIKIGDLNGTVVTMISIKDISDWCLEGVRYHVIDDESSCFSLRCSDFSFDFT